MTFRPTICLGSLPSSLQPCQRFKQQFSFPMPVWTTAVLDITAWAAENWYSNGKLVNLSTEVLSCFIFRAMLCRCLTPLDGVSSFFNSYVCVLASHCRWRAWFQGWQLLYWGLGRSFHVRAGGQLREVHYPYGNARCLNTPLLIMR